MKTLLFLAGVFLICSCAQPVSHKEQANLPPLERLKAGNQRFMGEYSIHPNESLMRIKDLKKGQNPFAVVVSCSDSRVPPELIFDQGFGDIFTIRTAGNVIGEYELGSIEYAVEHLHCNFIIVMGHEKCGAIGAYLSSNNQRHMNHIQSIVDYIADEEEEKAIMDNMRSNPDVAIRANIRHGVNTVRNATPILQPLVQDKQVTVVSAYYDLDTGKVHFDEM